MIVLTIDNSYSLVTGLTDLEFRGLRKILSYSLPYNPASKWSRGPQVRYLIDKKGSFASGLLSRVLKYFKDCNLQYQFIDLRIAPKAQEGMFDMKLGVSAHSWQISSVKASLERYRGIVSATTGTGKSIAMALLVNALQVKTLIVVPNLTLKHQLTDSFRTWFGDTKNITIENIDSNALDKTGQNYGCLIIDESHHVAAETYRRLNKRAWGKIFHRYYFTATPFRSRDEEQILFESVAGEVIYEIGYHDAVAEGYIVPVEAYYIEIPKTQVRGTTWPSVYSELVVNNKSRNKILHELLLKTVLNDLPTLCLVKEIKHGDILTASGGFNFVSGQDQDSKRYIELFNRQKFTALIGTTGVLGEGVDTRPAECIIIAGLGKSRPQFMQCVGRGIRRYGTKTSCKVIILLDKSHRWSIAHYKEQCKILKEEYGVVPVRIET